VPRIPVDLNSEVAAAVRGARDERFTKGAVKSAVRWALGVLAAGDTALDEAARPADVPALREALVRSTAPPVQRATVVRLSLTPDPPVLVAELDPGGARLALRAVEFPSPGWRLLALVAPGTDIPAALPERVLRFPVPTADISGRELGWLVSAVVDTAKALEADLEPAGRLDVRHWTDDLGMGEQRSVRSVAWEVGAVRVVADVAEHVVFDGATPAWTVLWAAADGLAGGAAVSLRATLRVGDEPEATLYVMAERDRLDRVRAPLTHPR
jgi:hypothetical protein